MDRRISLAPVSGTHPHGIGDINASTPRAYFGAQGTEMIINFSIVSGIVPNEGPYPDDGKFRDVKESAAGFYSGDLIVTLQKKDAANSTLTISFTVSSKVPGSGSGAGFLAAGDASNITDRD